MFTQHKKVRTRMHTRDKGALAGLQRLILSIHVPKIILLCREDDLFPKADVYVP
jgi:hypothetical protein